MTYFITPPSVKVKVELCRFFLENGINFSVHNQNGSLANLELYVTLFSHCPYVAVCLDGMYKGITLASWEFDSDKHLIPFNSDLKSDYFVQIVKTYHKDANFPVKLRGERID